MHYNILKNKEGNYYFASLYVPWHLLTEIGSHLATPITFPHPTVRNSSCYYQLWGSHCIVTWFRLLLQFLAYSYPLSWIPAAWCIFHKFLAGYFDIEVIAQNPNYHHYSDYLRQVLLVNSLNLKSHFRFCSLVDSPVKGHLGSFDVN